MSFRETVFEHLEHYVVEELEDGRKPGIFNYRNQELEKKHILPAADYQTNILRQFRSSFWASPHGAIKRHQYFHHLNSSQALCVNLFYPLVEVGMLNLFMEAAGIPQLPGPLQVAFEKESDAEVAERKTSFDFFIQCADNSKVYVEVKYTEGGFGVAKKDQEHIDKFQATYHPLLNNNPWLTSACGGETFFLDHYQLLRNLVHIGPDSHVVLVFPSANKDVAKAAEYAQQQLLTEAGRARLKIVTLEKFIPELVRRCAGGPLDGYYGTFSKKYLPPAA